jgi:predicted nucleic acid-binding protein
VLRVFLDTNIVLYALLNDDLAKAEKAIALIDSGQCISVQVLNEIVSVLRGRKKWPWVDVNAALSAITALLEVYDLTRQGQSKAVEIAARYGYSIYDANILASAKLSGCDVVWSEDMQHEQVIDGVRILNPFL